MERFEMMIDGGLVEFKSFLGKTKESISSLIEDIKANVLAYETRIKETEDEIKETESSSYTCEQEILRQQERIKALKKSIDNVEKTYKKIVDAYSSTSEGNTKDIYSDIIESARENCEKDVEKNNAEIEVINDTIYGIKNNIKEFNSTIDRLNRDLEEYQTELAKYTRALQYMQRVYDGVVDDLSDIESGKSVRVKVNTRKSDPIPESKPEKVVEEESEPIEDEKGPEVLEDSDDFEDYSQLEQEETIDEQEEPEEPIKEEAKPVYSGNLENLFLNSGVEDIKPEENNVPTTTEFNDNEMSEWEQMLNEKTITFDDPTKEDNSEEGTVNQLLKPYGTTYQRLVELADDRIEYKDGTILPITISIDDVLIAINQIDALDLKSMKIIGPETTLLKKIKKMKEEEK